MKIVRGVKRPNWICRNVRQNIVLVRDASGSMSGDKEEAASKASLNLVEELARTENKDGFSIAMVDFSETAEVVSELEKATVLVKALKPITTRGSTNVTAGLESALCILNRAEKDQVQHEGIAYLRPVVLVFSDGQHNEGPNPIDLAAKLKKTADIVAIAFGGDADEDMLKEIASSAQHFFRCSEGRELRVFLAAVGETISRTLAAGQDATQALGEMKQ